MSALDRTPSNTNFLLPNGFRVVVKKLPNTTYFTQSVKLPSVAIKQVDIPTPFVRMPITGDHIEYGFLSFTFAVDEDLNNYTEIVNWLKYGYPIDYTEYKELADKPPGSQLGLYSDISVTSTTNLKNPNKEFLFTDAFPVNLTSFELMTTDPSNDPIQVTVEFAFTNYIINNTA